MTPDNVTIERRLRQHYASLPGDPAAIERLRRTVSTPLSHETRRNRWPGAVVAAAVVAIAGAGWAVAAHHHSGATTEPHTPASRATNRSPSHTVTSAPSKPAGLPWPRGDAPILIPLTHIGTYTVDSATVRLKRAPHSIAIDAKVLPNPSAVTMAGPHLMLVEVVNTGRWKLTGSFTVTKIDQKSYLRINPPECGYGNEFTTC